MNIKDAVKKRLNSGDRIDAKVLYESIKDFDYVSFDIFDTLVKRNVAEARDIFSIIEKSVGSEFKSTRIKAEKRARAESDKREISIEDIYKYFPEEDQKKLISVEIETEIESIVPNLPIAKIFKKCLLEGKTIFVISDIYWPEESIKKLLNKNGFDGYKTLYLSCSKQKLKSDGSLFQYLLDSEKIESKQLIHIGDSQKSDKDEPEKLGITSLKIPRYFKNIKYRGDGKNHRIELNYLNHFINNTFPYSKDPYYQFGYSQFGKLLYSYVNWIHDESAKRGIKKIFFFSRDGYIMKLAYEACISDVSIKTRYLEVSRRSLRVPVLWMDCTYETILKMVINAKLITIESVFDGLGLNIQNYKKTLRKHGLSHNMTFDRSVIKKNKKLRSLIEDITPDIINNSKKEYNLLIRYLKENDVSGRFAVVDIGYAGSMQCYLQQILTKSGIEHDISGFYLAVADFYTKNMLPGVKLDLNGYLFDFQHDSNAVDTRRSFVGLFETLFLEQRGSVKKYICDKDSINVERYPYEYDTDDNSTDDSVKVKSIQRGALDFVTTASKDKLLNELRCNTTDYFSGLFAVGTDPTLRDLKLFGNISFYDEGIIEKLASPKSIVYYIIQMQEQ